MNRLFKIFIGICLLLLVPVSLFAGNKIKVIFRYDDYTLTNNRLDSAVLSSFLQHDIPLSLGVIPFNENGQLIFAIDAAKLNTLREIAGQGKIEIALHGFCHTQKYRSGEFGGMPYEEQILKLSQGKRALDSMLYYNVTTFIPPWNAYDENTIKALEKCGFNTISSDLFGCPSGISDKINYVPHTVDNLACLINIIEHAPSSGNLLIVVMFHGYDFIESGDTTNLSAKKISYSDLEHVLTQLKKYSTIEYLTFKDIVASNEDLSYNRMELNTRSFLTKKLFGYNNHYYLKSETVKKLWIYNYVLYVFVFVSAFFFSSFVLKYIKNKYIILSCLTVIISMVLTIILRSLFTPLKLLLLTICVSVIFALLINIRKIVIKL